MNHLLCVLLLLSAVAVGAQAPQGTAPKPAPQTPAPQEPTSKPQAPAQPRTQPRQPGGVTLSVQVTDRSGNPIGDVDVRAGGPVDRTGTTGQDGSVAFRSIRPGTYRLRFEREGFTTLEREVVIRSAAADVSVALSAAPAPPKPEPVTRDPEPPPAPSRTPRDVDPHVMSIGDYLDKNLIRSEPQKISLLGCAEGGTARLVQVREPLVNRQNADADELLYVVAGDGVLRIRNQDTSVRASHFALIPRGTPYGLRREGRSPAVVVVSVLAGPACAEPGTPAR